MNTDLISGPSISHRGRRRLLTAVLGTAVVVAVAGALVVARSSGGSSGEHALAEPSAVVSPATSPECGVNLDYLAAEVRTMPESVRPGVIAGLSPQVHQLVDKAMANQSAIHAGSVQYGFSYTPPVPDGPTLARVLATIPAADARAIVSGLSTEGRAEIGASYLSAWPAGTMCP
jgi:hypothetical protein